MHESAPAKRSPRVDAQRNYASLLQAARVAVAERGPELVMEEIAKSAGVAIGTLYRHFPTRQDLLEAVFLDETKALKEYAEALANAPVPVDAFVSWLRLQMDFAARGRSLGAAVMAAKHIPGTKIAEANRAMHEAGAVLLQRAQAAGQLRKDVHMLDIIRLVYGIAMVNEYANDPEGANRMLDLVCDSIRARPERA
jgi:AcrR family transcriptional regulator